MILFKTHCDRARPSCSHFRRLSSNKHTVKFRQRIMVYSMTKKTNQALSQLIYYSENLAHRKNVEMEFVNEFTGMYCT